MPKTFPAAGEAMPTSKPTDEQLADAMRDLETPIRDLMHMADITCEKLLDLFDQPDQHEGDKLVFHFTMEQRDRFLFAVCDVERRAKAVHELHSAAFCGGSGQ
jgi:hypothetical protein